MQFNVLYPGQFKALTPKTSADVTQPFKQSESRPPSYDRTIRTVATIAMFSAMWSTFPPTAGPPSTDLIGISVNPISSFPISGARLPDSSIITGPFTQPPIAVLAPFKAALQQTTSFTRIVVVVFNPSPQFQDQPQFRQPFIDRSFESSFEQPPGTLSYVTGYQFQDQPQFRQPFIDRSFESSFEQPPGTLAFQWGFHFRDQPQFRQPFIDRSFESSFEQPPGTLSYVTGYQFQDQPQFRQPFIDRSFESSFEQPPGTLSFQWGYHYQNPELQFRQPFLDRINLGFIFTPAGAATPSDWGMFSQSEALQIKQAFRSGNIDGFIFTPAGTATPSDWGMFSTYPVLFKPTFRSGNIDGFVQPPGTLSFQWGFHYQQPVIFRLPFIDRSFENSFEQPPGTLSYVTGYQYQSPVVFAKPFPAAQQYYAGFEQPPGTLSFQWGFHYQQPVVFQLPFLARAISGFVQPPGTLSYVTGYQYQSPTAFAKAFPTAAQWAAGFVQPPGTLYFRWGFQGPQPQVQAPRPVQTFNAFVVQPTVVFTPSDWGMFSQSPIKTLPPNFPRNIDGFIFIPVAAATPSDWGMFSPSPVQFKGRFLTRQIDGFRQPTGTLSFNWGFQGPQPHVTTPRQFRAYDAFVRFVAIAATPSNWGMFSQSPIKVRPRDFPRQYDQHPMRRTFTPVPTSIGMFGSSPIYVRRYDLRTVDLHQQNLFPFRRPFTGIGFLTAKWLDRLQPGESLAVSTWQVPSELRLLASGFTDFMTEVKYGNAHEGKIYEFRNYIVTTNGRVMDRIIFTPLLEAGGIGVPGALFTIPLVAATTFILASSSKSSSSA